MWSLDTLIWFIIGGLLVAGIAFLINVIRKNNVSVRWYEWLIGILGMVLFLFTIQNFYTAFEELAPKAAWMFLLVTGLPSLILMAISWQLVARRQKTS